MNKIYWKSSKDGWVYLFKEGRAVEATLHIGTQWDGWRNETVHRFVRKGGSPRSRKLDEVFQLFDTPQAAITYFLDSATLRLNKASEEVRMQEARLSQLRAELSTAGELWQKAKKELERISGKPELT